MHLNGRKWYFQKKLLRESSSYFENKLDNDNRLESWEDFKESPGVTGLLDSSEPFELFVQWLYSGTIDDISTSPDFDHGAQLDIYIRLWYLCASRGLNLPDLQDLALTRMKELYHTHGVSFSADHIRFIYERKCSPDPLRQHAVDAATHDLMAAGPSATISRSSSSVDEPANTPPPSYTYRSTSRKFANDLLDNVLRHTGSAQAPHPFLAPPSPSSPTLFFTPSTHPSQPSIHQSQPSTHASQPSILVPANPPPTPESIPRRHSNGTGTGTATGSSSGTGSPRERTRPRENGSLNPTDIRSRGQSGFHFSSSEDPFVRANETEPASAPSLEPEPEPQQEPKSEAEAEAEVNANAAPAPAPTTTQTGET